MNDIATYDLRQHQTSHSWVMHAALAAMVTASPITDVPQEQEKDNVSIVFNGSHATIGQYNPEAIGSKVSQIDNNFEQEMSDFYSKLLYSQEPLGTDFEKVLYDNLWDLYQS